MKLLEKAHIGSLELKNRMVMPPMGTMFANEDGTVSERTINYYSRRARGGVALVVVEIAAVDPIHYVSPRELRISDDKYIEGLSRLARAIKDGGAKAALQLHHPGRTAYSRVTGVQPVAPSPIPDPTVGEVPRELSGEEIKTLVKYFTDAARRAREAGFDAIELHGAHGYLLCQFLSPYSNHRTDEYGGDPRRRARFALDIMASIRKALGRDYPIIFRISADEFVPGGLTLQETKPLSKMLQEAGVDCLSVSGGNYVSFEWVVQPVLMPRGCLVHLAAAIKPGVTIPVITVGRINQPDLAERILQQGKADLVALGRTLIADPDFPMKVAEGRQKEIRQCIACDSCEDRVRRGASIGCLVNPEAGVEGQEEEKAPRAKKALVIGGGPAGLEAARILALRGHKVTLWEEKPSLGGRWSWLIKPYIKVQTDALKKLGVKLELGRGVSKEKVAEFSPEVVLATPPLIPVMPEDLDLDRQKVYLAEEVLEGEKGLKGETIILGAGNAGIEVAWRLSHQGQKVTILEESRREGKGLEFSMRQAALADLRRHNVESVVEAKVKDIRSNTVTFLGKDGKEHKRQADNIVIALGYRPDLDKIERLKGRGYEVQPLPPCDQPQWAYTTSLEGAAIARRV